MRIGEEGRDGEGCCLGEKAEAGPGGEKPAREALFMSNPGQKKVNTIKTAMLFVCKARKQMVKSLFLSILPDPRAP